MKVVLDTNIIIPDIYMALPNFAVILASAKEGDIELHIPEIVLDEVLNKFRQRVEKSQKGISGEMAKFSKLVRAEYESPITSELVNEVCQEHETHLRKVIADNKIVITPYPNTPHKFLAQKAMLAKKPFNINEKGYRDNLIWENIKSFISGEDTEIASSPEVIFVTANHKDFMADENELHHDLIIELESQDLKTETVVMYTELKDFNDKVTKLFFEQASTLEGKLKNDEFWDFKLKETIDAYLFKEVAGHGLGNYREYVPAANDRPIVESIDDTYIIDNISVKKLSADQYLVDVAFDLDMEVGFYVDKSEYYRSESEDYYVIDFDWNDHVIHASQSIKIAMSISLVINSNLGCKSIQINNLGDSYSDYY
jgi:predicted nucleic acid-binding protein